MECFTFSEVQYIIMVVGWGSLQAGMVPEKQLRVLPLASNNK